MDGRTRTATSAEPMRIGAAERVLTRLAADWAAPPTPEPVPQTFPVTTPGLLTEPDQFENIILRADEDSAAITRIKNVGRADLGRKDYSIRSKYQGKDATLIVVYQQPGANAIETSNGVIHVINKVILPADS